MDQETSPIKNLNHGGKILIDSPKYRFFKPPFFISHYKLTSLFFDSSNWIQVNWKHCVPHQITSNTLIKIKVEPFQEKNSPNCIKI